MSECRPGIDAVPWDEQAWLHSDVGGRKTKRPAPLVARDDDPFHLRRTAEEAGGADDIAGVEKLADPARGDAFYERNRADLESEPAEEWDIALAPLSEAKGLRRDHDTRAKRLENVSNEVFRLPSRQLGRELEDEQLVRPDFLNQLDAALQRRDQLDVVPEDAARVWVERDDRRAETGPDRLLDGRPMAPMDAVEGADRDGALGRLELSRCADDLQMASSGRSRSLGTGDGMSHRTPARAPTVVIQSAGRNPSAAPSQPPARDPSGRMP